MRLYFQAETVRSSPVLRVKRRNCSVSGLKKYNSLSQLNKNPYGYYSNGRELFVKLRADISESKNIKSEFSKSYKSVKIVSCSK